jgi:hypothetical protein
MGLYITGMCWCPQDFASTICDLLWQKEAQGVFFFFSVHSCLEELFSKEYYSSKVI